MLTLILSLLILAGLLGLAWGIRACGQELKGLDEESKRGPDMEKDIEIWRDRK